MRVSRRELAGFAVAMSAAGTTARATGSPLPASTLVVPFSAGGSADMAARSLARHASPLLPGQPAIAVESRVGASGAVGTLSVSRAAPDGRVLLLARVGSSAILPALDSRTPFAWDDFSFLGLLDENPFLLAVRADAPWRDAAELATALRDEPGQLVFATSGPATLLDLGIRQFFIAAGLELDAATALVLRGGGEAVQALVEGRARFIGNNLPDLVEAMRAGSVRALAVSGTARLAEFPQVPTMREAGFPALEPLSGWSALAGPPGLPAEIIQAWAAALEQLGRSPAWLEEVRQQGSQPRLLPPEATRAYVGAQVALYRELGRRLGLV